MGFDGHGSHLKLDLANGHLVPVEEYVMSQSSGKGIESALTFLLALLAFSPCASGQASTALLKLQNSHAYLNIEEHRQGKGNNVNDISLGDPRDVWQYPNSVACLVVYSDGRYALEKREEQTVGRPKVKSAVGTLAGDELEQLKGILENDDLKKITSPKMPELPADTQALREIESLDVQIDHAGTPQRITTVKERVKTGALVSATSGPSSGLDTFLDNGTGYKKTLSPLLKWFEGLQKKNKSNLKESKPQYCAPINIG